MSAEADWLNEQIRRIDATIALMETISGALLPNALGDAKKERATVASILRIFEAPKPIDAKIRHVRNDGLPTY